MKHKKHISLLACGGGGRAAALALAVLGLHAPAPAQDNTVPAPGYLSADSTITRPARVSFVVPQGYDLADGVTFTLENAAPVSGNGAVFEISLPTIDSIFYIRPGSDETGQTGRFIFRNNTAAAYSGAVHVGKGTLVLNNGSIINNSSGNIGGAFTVGSNGAIRFTNLLFEGNHAVNSGGAIDIRASAAARPLQSITSSTFIGNYTIFTNSNENGGGGAIRLATGLPTVDIINSAFISNRTPVSGGALFLGASAGGADLLLQDVTTISGNWAGVHGGAIFDYVGAGNSSRPIIISLSGSLAGQHIVYENNAAGVGAANGTSAAAIAAVESGTYLFAPKASGGGFYYSRVFGSLRFNIAENVTLSIGRAGNDPNLDSIATKNDTNAYKTILAKAGAGKLIFNADNAYFQGVVNVEAGSLLLGNQDARLGGSITISSGATFGGAGTLTTLATSGDPTASPNKTAVTATTNAFLQVGTETATDAGTLNILGNLAMADGFTISHDLFASGSASLLKVQGLALAGTGTINLGLLATGSFTLAQWESGGVDLGQLALTIGGVADNPRSTGTLSVDSSAGQLVVTNTVNNLRMQWTGAEGSTWLRRPADHDRSWSDAAASGESRFFNGDTVIFDGVADAGNEANRVITIETGGVIASGMEVGGTARYEFRGDGPITVRSDAVGNAAFAATGKLAKSGEGELVFSNNGDNLFAGGIEMAGGAITFDQARQLATEASINFIGTGTLRAAGTTADRGTLTGGITIAAGKTAELEVTSGTLMHSSTCAVSSASADSVLRKTGGGELRLLGDSSANVGAVAIDGGSLRLGADAGLGGRITVGAGATLGGSGTVGVNGGVKVLSGGVLDLGLDPAAAGRLTVTNLEMTGGAILRVSLFDADAGDGYRLSDHVLETGASTFSGENYIDLTSFASGTFSLGNIGGLAAGAKTTISGMELPADGRLSAELANISGTLRLIASSDKSRRVTWTGASGTTWNLVGSNWTGSDSVSTYSYGDHVVFDGVADAGQPGNRDIFINATEVRVSDLTVAGGADYAFTGGGIHAAAANVLANASGEVELTGATGRLVKTGAGTLTFANDANTFAGGIDIGGGVIAISRGDQLGTSPGAGITFSASGTVRVSDSATPAAAPASGAESAVPATIVPAVVLDNLFAIASAATAAFDTNGRDMALSGSVVGAIDSRLEKLGAGALVLDADVSGHAGAISVRGGSLIVTAQNVLGAASGVEVEAGATLDLAGHNQSLASLSGTGEVALGGADLKMTVATDAVFAGGFSGEGKVYKNGAGKWTLSGSSSHTGGFDYEDGVLGLAGSHALGSGLVTVKAAAPRISIEAAGLAIGNDFDLGATATEINNNGHQVEFSGALAGTGQLTLEGSGTTILSGRNSYANLVVNVPRLVMRRSESASNRVTVGTGSVLEFQSVPGGDVNGILAGDRVLFTSSTLTLRGANAVRDFEVAHGSDLMIDSAGALGGSGADVTIRDGGLIRLTKPEVLARNIRVDGGAIVFATYYNMTALKLAGSLDFSNGGEIHLGGLLPTGIYTAATAAAGIPAMPAYDPHQNGMFMVVDIVDGDKLRLTAYNMALEPGKDVNVGFDSLLASMRSVYAHVSEEFLAPLTGRDGKNRGAADRGVWFRVVGSFAEYGDDIDHLGYQDTTVAGILGCDWISRKDLMLGAYFGLSDTSLETSNNATTDISLPHAGLYAGVRRGGFHLTADVTAGLGSADTVRREDQGNVVTGGYDVDSFGASIEVGYTLRPFSNGGLRPAIGLHYMHLDFHDYRETGLGSVRLDSFKTHSMEAVFACNLNREIKLPWGQPGMVDVRLGWRENLHIGRSDIWATMVDYPDARLRIRGDRYDGSGITCGLGLRMALSRRLFFAFMYDFDYIPMGIHDNDTIRNTLNSVLRVSW